MMTLLKTLMKMKVNLRRMIEDDAAEQDDPQVDSDDS